MKAIVFDNAGTIIKRVTALKDTNSNKLIFESNTIGMVNKNDDSLILVFQTPTKQLIQYDKKIIDYLKDNIEKFEIGYSKKNYTKHDVIQVLEKDTSTFEDIRESASSLIKNYDIEICSGSALIINIGTKKIDYAYTAGGLFFKDTLKLFKQLKKLDYHIFIASGDNKQSLSKIAKTLNIPQTNIYDTCNMDCKEKVISKLKEKYDQVIMVGNNTNDYSALKKADIGILTTEQGEKLPEYLLNSVDFVINKISDVLKIIEKGD
ncbi:HAD family hydrolase [Methanosphaera sp. ISO3-F5]|uniref:HAD family hydrolase n=1 Tax=Methanosphaera sp. ISO3-F5 TaxID=1452353 RepID=UPI002B261CBB|nr:HAD family hydrolase [Methanosphaera sp. ISO3-F5]WQH65106.1 HAD family hydrolase [Methanosphaera sp. ISO3-F5]